MQYGVQGAYQHARGFRGMYACIPPWQLYLRREGHPGDWSSSVAALHRDQ